MHKSDRRLYLDANDQVVEADDPSRAKLLVSEGGKLPMEEARRYGLVGDAHTAPTGQGTAIAANVPKFHPDAPAKPSEAPKKKA